MVMVIDSEIWQPPQWFYAFLVCSCGAAICGRFHFIYKRSRMISPNLESSVNSFMNLPSSFLTFQRSFLSAYFLASGELPLPFIFTDSKKRIMFTIVFKVAEGLHAVYGESLYRQYGFAREDMALLFASGYLASLFFGTFLGCLSDFIGRKKACIMFCVLHIIGSLAMQFNKYYSIWMGTVSLAIASSLFSCTFETWMAAEHEKLGFRQEWLSDTFWTMSFGGAASSLGSSALANALVNWKTDHGLTLPLVAATIVAVICTILIVKRWGENMTTFKVKIPTTVLLFTHLMADKRILLLAWAQVCLDFAVSIFWFLWTPTIVADGREVNISMIYPCLMGSTMLGSLAVSWLLCGPHFMRPEAYLTTAFVTASFCLAVPAYDYQEVGVLVALFCLFNACVGIISPSLARLRSIYVPSDMRAGMISISRVPVNIAVVFVLMRGGYYHNLENSTILTMCVLGLLSGAGCLHILNRWSCVANGNLDIQHNWVFYLLLKLKGHQS